jgi:hypothetical protein
MKNEKKFRKDLAIPKTFYVQLIEAEFIMFKILKKKYVGSSSTYWSRNFRLILIFKRSFGLFQTLDIFAT